MKFKNSLVLKCILVVLLKTVVVGNSFEATMYCLRGKTKSGELAKHGIVAADPQVLPLGTKIRLRGKSINGVYVVKDTGKNIKGKRIDIWVPYKTTALKFGRQKIHVEIVK